MALKLIYHIVLMLSRSQLMNKYMDIHTDMDMGMSMDIGMDIMNKLDGP